MSVYTVHYTTNDKKELKFSSHSPAIIKREMKEKKFKGRSQSPGGWVTDHYETKTPTVVELPDGKVISWSDFVVGVARKKILPLSDTSKDKKVSAEKGSYILRVIQIGASTSKEDIKCHSIQQVYTLGKKFPDRKKALVKAEKWLESEKCAHEVVLPDGTEMMWEDFCKVMKHLMKQLKKK